MNKSVRNAIVRLFLAGALFTAVATQLFAAEFICGSNGVLYMWTGYGWVVSGHCAPSTL